MTIDRNAKAIPADTGFVLTGRWVLFYLVLFFGTIFGVNFYMARAAITTFSGLEADKPYQEGVKYDDEIAASRAQDKLGWTVDVKVRKAAEGTSSIEIRQADKAGTPTAGLAFNAKFIHPADRRRDLPVALVKIEPGVYRGEVPANAGRWDLLVEGSNASQILFRSQSRLDLAGAR